jgi:hypothetical protein
MSSHDQTQPTTVTDAEAFFESGSNVPEEKQMYVVFTCEDGHQTAVYPYPINTTKIRQLGRCQSSVRHVAKEKMDVYGFKVDKPVTVWFGGKTSGTVPWLSMMRACDKCFVEYQSVPVKELEVEFGTAAAEQGEEQI